MSLFDERFLTHRLRATSIAGIASGTLATVLWFYHYVFEHHWSWELLAIPLTMAIVKQGLMLWYRFRD
jgi:hypothetical protein